MKELNLPTYPAKIKQDTNNGYQIFDEIRKRFVRLSAEEWVRQCFVHYLMDTYEYPRGLIMNEVTLCVGDMTKRADTVVYDRSLRARMLIEYKAPSVSLNQKVIDQILIYDIVFQVEYLVITNGLKHLAYRVNKEDNSFIPLEYIPKIGDIMGE